MPKKLFIPPVQDAWDEEKSEFTTFGGQMLVVEHSLISVSKWEQKWKKPFISEDPRTKEEFVDYIRCMTLNNVDDTVYAFITNENIAEIEEYIADPMTATTITDNKKSVKKEIITSEIIYYRMLSFGIPVEFEKWHLNRLITLIRVFDIKNGGQKKMSASEAALFQRSINDQRLAKNKHRR